ncbi:MAG: hypothetical protein IJT18_07760 [Oscillospiraceae bacterium]|nr:hypothetical protein [Oscillospiraceae bacterium]
MEEKNNPAPVQEPVPAGKRSALLRYMAILFIVAFILVVISLIMQINSSNDTISDLSSASTGALARAEELQQEVIDLRAQLDAANEEIDALTAEKEELLQKQQEAQTALDNAENQHDAYDALLTVLTAKPVEGDIAYAKAVQTAQNLREYLSPEAQALLDAHLNAQNEAEQ